MRDKIISAYACNRTSGKQYNIGYSDALRQLYGEHNLTSDTEPEEMLMVERKYIQEMYADGVGTHYLLNLFGDKCLPDELEHRLEQTVQESVQVKSKPKFKVGDKVFAKNSNQILTIKGIRYDSQKYDCGGFGFVPWDSLILEPYTEESRNLSQNIANCDKQTDKQLKDNGGLRMCGNGSARH